ncbi:pyridoxal-phosphate dependent enzyme [Halomonas sp.]|uniref:threonine synthase n=1 Tax=Halomonas sp. TaxID=1486246 RepID=UPI00356597ED
MTTEDHLVCTTCGAEVSIMTVPSTCLDCGGILDVQLGTAAQAQTAASGAREIWQWAPLLPHCSPENRISLGEAGSPLLKAERFGAACGLEDLWIKTDSVMPTGSFKDRAISLGTSLACEYGREALVLSSSGNAGASGAAYAARAGKPVVVLVPKTAPEAKLRQIAVTGARLVTVDGPTSECCRLADELARERGWVNLTTTFHNPYGVEAYATIAYELAAAAPDVLLLPISSGPLLVGLMKGFSRLKAQGRIARIPRPIAVQPSACAPIARAFSEGGGVRPWQHQTTVASALNDTLAGYERDGDYTLEHIRENDGAAIALDDAQTLEGVRQAASLEGVVLEPSAAITLAAVEPLREKGVIAAENRIVVVATGHGLKDLFHVEINLQEAIEPDTEKLLSRLAAR